MDPLKPSSSDSNRDEKAATHDDARLRSFLRKAVAVIAAERGLNARSRLKLESLARHQKLPDELFAVAMRRLQENDESVGELSRYEGAFIRFLSKELKKLRSQVLSIAAEQRAIDLASAKYQIAAPRAEQLIQQQAELEGIERISRSEAEVYGSRLISETIGTQTVIDNEIHEELYRKAGKLGLDRERVDQEILRLLDLNRDGQKPRRRLRWGIAGLSILVVCVLAIGRYAEWFSFPIKEPAPIPVEVVNVDTMPKEPSRPPDWLSDATIERVRLSTDRGLPGLAELVFSIETADRKTGYQNLVDAICSQPLSNRKLFEDLASQLYYEEPTSRIAAIFVDRASRYLRLPASGLVTKDHTFEGQYRANQLLGVMYANIPESNFTERIRQRRASLSNRIRELTGIDPDQLLFAEYVQQSEREIAAGQWNRVVQDCWESPGRAAVLVQPLVNLTRSRLPAETLKIYRVRLLQSILQLDSRQWSAARLPFRNAISAAGKSELIEWSELVLELSDGELTRFAGPLLLQQADIEVTSTQLPMIEKALKTFTRNYRSRALQPLLTRSQRIGAITDELLQEANVELLLASPDQIAKLGFAIDLNLAICRQVQSGQFLQHSDFRELDERLDRPEIRLRELVSLPGKTDGVAVQGTATASDRNRKDNALQILGNVNSNSITKRINALAQLQRVAARFQDLSYSDATILAAYFLADNTDAERVNIQNLISSFADWPTLGLAVADQITADQITQQSADLDRVLTVARLLTGEEFELEGSKEEWPVFLQRQMIEAMAAQVEVRLDSDPANTKSDWMRLQVFFADLYRSRAALWFGGTVRVGNPELGIANLPSEILLTIIDAKLEGSMLPMNVKRRLVAGISLIRRESSGELENTILANQLLVEILCSEIQRQSKSATGEMRQIQAKFDQSLGRSNVLADQLYQVNLGLLRLAALKRETMIKMMIDNHSNTANEPH